MHAHTNWRISSKKHGMKAVFFFKGRIFREKKGFAAFSAVRERKKNAFAFREYKPDEPKGEKSSRISEDA